MKHLYGEFTDEQMCEYIKSLHTSVHWLLKYKELNYDHLDSYFSNLLSKICGTSYILSNPPEIVDLISILQMAMLELDKNDEEFDFGNYRKLILKAHHIIDDIKY